MQEESKRYLGWYNQFRPHQTLNGRTPDDVFFLVGSTTLSRPLGDREPVNDKPRWELRKGWPRKTVCAAPWAVVKGRRGAKAELRVSFLEGLPGEAARLSLELTLAPRKIRASYQSARSGRLRDSNHLGRIPHAVSGAAC